MSVYVLQDHLDDLLRSLREDDMTGEDLDLIRTLEAWIREVEESERSLNSEPSDY